MKNEKLNRICDRTLHFALCALHSTITHLVMTALTPCKHMVSDLFHRPSGLLFTFPSRYLFTIGLEKYLDLPVSTGGFPRAIRVPGYLRIEIKKIYYFRIRGYHPLGLDFPDDSSNNKFCNFSAINSTSLPCNLPLRSSLTLGATRDEPHHFWLGLSREALCIGKERSGI
jgi:hypothetical protein